MLSPNELAKSFSRVSRLRGWDVRSSLEHVLRNSNSASVRVRDPSHVTKTIDSGEHSPQYQARHCWHVRDVRLIQVIHGRFAHTCHHLVPTPQEDGATATLVELEVALRRFRYLRTRWRSRSQLLLTRITCSWLRRKPIRNRLRELHGRKLIMSCWRRMERCWRCGHATGL